MAMTDTLHDLELVATLLKDAQAHARDLEEDRNLLITHAFAENYSQVDIGRAAGVTRARVHQIIS